MNMDPSVQSSITTKVHHDSNDSDEKHRCNPTNISDCLPLDIIYENEDYIIINKPPDIRMDGNEYHCTIEKILKCHLANLNHAQTMAYSNDRVINDDSDHKVLYKWIHQLDYATSGVLAIAKHKDAAIVGTQSFGRRETSKEYIAVVYGHIPLGLELESECESGILLNNKECCYLNKFPLVSDTLLKSGAHECSGDADSENKRKKKRGDDINVDMVEIQNGVMQLKCLMEHLTASTSNSDTKNCISGDEWSILQRLCTIPMSEYGLNKRYRKLLRKQLKRYEELLVDFTWNGDNALCPLSVGSAGEKLIAVPINTDCNSKIISGCNPESTKECNQNHAYPPRIYRMPCPNAGTPGSIPSATPPSRPSYKIIINIPISDQAPASSSCSHRLIPGGPNPPPSNSSQEVDPFAMHEGRRVDEYMLCGSSSCYVPTSVDSKPTAEELLGVGREAETILHVLEYGYILSEDHTELVPVTKVKLCPITGRRHQLRVHCRALGNPIVGDETYSREWLRNWQYMKRNLNECELIKLRQDVNSACARGGSNFRSFMSDGTDRMMLHAHSLRLPTPALCYSTSNVNNNADNIPHRGPASPKKDHFEPDAELSFKKRRQLYPDYSCQLRATVEEGNELASALHSKEECAHKVDEGSNCTSNINAASVLMLRTNPIKASVHDRIVLNAIAADPFPFVTVPISHVPNDSNSDPIPVEGYGESQGEAPHCERKQVSVLSTILPHFAQ